MALPIRKSLLATVLGLVLAGMVAWFSYCPEDQKESCCPTESAATVAAAPAADEAQPEAEAKPVSKPVRSLANIKTNVPLEALQPRPAVTVVKKSDVAPPQTAEGDSE